MSPQADAARWMRAHAHELAEFELSESNRVRLMSELVRTGPEGQVQEFLDWFQPSSEEEELHSLAYWLNGDEEPVEDDWSFL